MSDNPTEKPHLSASQLGMLERCGVAYTKRYIDKVVAPPPGALLHAGRGTHKAVEADLTEKIATEILLPDDAIPDLARDATLASIEESGLSKEQHGSVQDARGLAVDRAVRLAVLHHEQVAPGLQPTHVERKFRVELDNFPYDLVGFIDVQEEGRIRDTKTTSKSKSQKDADTSQQLTVYAAGHLAVEGALPDELALDVLVDTKKPKVQQLITRRSEANVDMLLRRVERAALVIERGAFTPAPTDSWQCSQRWCSYWTDCDFAARPA